MAKKRRRRKLKKGPVIILSLILVLLIGLFIFLIYTNTSKYLFFKGISKTSDNILDNYNTFISNYVPYINDNYYNNTDTSILIETEELNKSINFKGDIYLTDKSNYFDLNIDANKAEYQLELLTKDNKLYYAIDDSKYYYMDNESNTFTTNYTDLFEVLIKSIKNNVSNSNFEKTKEKIEVNSKTYNSKKVTLSIDSDKYYEIMNSFYEKVKSSDELIDSLFSISSYETREDLINYIDSFKENGNKEEKTIIYSIYLYKSKPIMNEIILEDYEVSYITYDDYLEFNYKEGDNSSYVKVFDNKLDIFINGIGYGTGKYDDNSFNVDFVDYEKKSLGSISYLIDKKSKNYSTKLDLSIELELLKIDIDSSNKINVDKSIPDININNSVISDNMTENDRKTLEELLSLTNDIIAF